MNDIYLMTNRPFNAIPPEGVNPNPNPDPKPNPNPKPNPEPNPDPNPNPNPILTLGNPISKP
eukprot:1369058-Amorphochlora_amoeboformis.AAC.2